MKVWRLLKTNMCYLGVWGKFILYKYVGAWLLNEGACILIGLTYNGTDCALNPLWDGCETVNVGKFEKAASFSELVDCFYANMHHWLSEYVYKRLKFLSKLIALRWSFVKASLISIVDCKPKSQCITLLFFALWHGFSSGFYFTFILVFTTMFFEREVRTFRDNTKFSLSLMFFVAKEDYHRKSPFSSLLSGETNRPTIDHFPLFLHQHLYGFYTDPICVPQTIQISYSFVQHKLYRLLFLFLMAHLSADC